MTFARLPRTATGADECSASVGRHGPAPARPAGDLAAASTLQAGPRVQRKCAACAAAEREGRPAPCADCATEAVLQRRGRAAAGPDRHERSADRAADRVLGGGGGAAAIACQSGRAGVGDPAPPGLLAGAGPGRPLDPSTRSRFESRFGHDFGDVSLHVGPAAAASARGVDAAAYTTGSAIVFGGGEYAPGTTSGDRLLAHELAHVVQQRGQGPALQRQAAICGAHAAAEVETPRADALAKLSAAEALLRRQPASAAVKAAMWLAFRTDSVASIAVLAARLQVIRAGLSSARFAWIQAPNPDHQQVCVARRFSAYVDRVGEGTHERWLDPINLCCPEFPGEGANRPYVLIHEAAHRYLGVHDRGYLTGSFWDTPTDRTAREERSGTIEDSVWTRLDNADAHAALVYYLTAGTPTVDPVARRATYQGADLKIRWSGDPLLGDADPDLTTRPTIHTREGIGMTFSIAGLPGDPAPLAGGNLAPHILYRWYMVGKAGAGMLNVQYALTTPDDRLAHAMDTRNSRVRVSETMRHILEGHRVTKVDVCCHVDLSRVGGPADRRVCIEADVVRDPTGTTP